MVNNSIDIRIKFRKTGRSIYISHLDLQRAMQRALKRTKLPIWYTMGFNPHAYVTFPLSLALGFESECEFMDFAIDYDVPLEEIMAQLKNVLPQGIELLDVSHPKYINKDIASSVYSVVLDIPGNSEINIKSLYDYFNSDYVEVSKLNKKKELVTNNIKGSFSILDLKSIDDKINVEICLPSGTEININPTHVFEGYSRITDTKINNIRIKRTKILTKSCDIFS